MPERHARGHAALTAIVVVMATLISACSSGGGDWVADSNEGAGPAGGGAVDAAVDGHLADGETVSPFDTDLAAIANLEPSLRDAVQEAALAARADDVELRVASGWRSERLQHQLLDQAVDRYGSEAEAARWVSTAERSAHVRGAAVDIAPVDAASWLAQHGETFGLCPRYANEPWHFEQLVEPGGTCPAVLEDAAAS